MPLQLHPLGLSDFETITSHASDSYPGDDLVAPPNPVTWPVSTRAEAQDRLEFCMAMQRKRFLEDRTCHFMKVVDVPADNSSDSGEIISVARWHRYPTGYDYAKEAHWEMAFPSFEALSDPGKAKGLKKEAHDFILTARDSYREEWIPKGKPAWILMHLVTRPSQRGRGAAGMLIRWGQEKAAEESACAYLESGAAARPLYARYGFEQVGAVRLLDLTPHGLELQFQLANMRWPSHVSGNETNDLSKTN